MGEQVDQVDEQVDQVDEQVDEQVEQTTAEVDEAENGEQVAVQVVAEFAWQVEQALTE